MDEAEVLKWIKDKIETNGKQTVDRNYFRGANEALEELAVQYGLVNNYGILIIK